MLSGKINKISLVDAIQVTRPGDYFLEAFDRNEVHATISHVSKYFHTYTAHYRLSLAIDRLEKIAKDSEVMLDDMSTLTLDEKFEKLRDQLEGPFNRLIDKKGLEAFADFYKPYYVKKLFWKWECISSQLKSLNFFTSVNANSALQTGNENTDISIAEALNSGADVNIECRNSLTSKKTLLASALHYLQKTAIEEILSEPELKVRDDDFENLKFSNKYDLFYLQGLLLKGASERKILTLFFQEAWFNSNILNPIAIVEFFDFCLPLIKDELSADIVLTILDPQPYDSRLAQIYRSYQVKKLSTLLIEIFARIVAIKNSTHEILQLMLHDDAHFLNQLSREHISINLLFIKFIASIATINNSTEIYKVFTQQFEEFSFSENYLCFIKSHDYLLKKTLELMPKQLSQDLRCKAGYSEPLSSDEQIPNSIIQANLESVFSFHYKNDGLLINCVLYLCGAKDALKLNYNFVSNLNKIGNGPAFKATLFLSLPKEEFNKLFGELNTEKTIRYGIRLDFSSEEIFKDSNSLETKNEIKIEINFNKTLFADEKFLGELKEIYNSFLISKDKFTQQYLDNTFKNLGLMPSGPELAKQFNELNTDFIAKAGNQTKTTKLIANIQLFINQLNIFPRNPAIRFLSQKIYEDTQPARLITKFGIIRPQRQLLEPIHEAAQRLCNRYP